MDSQVLAALIGLLGVILGAILQAVLPDSRITGWLSGKPKAHRLTGAWKSSWGDIAGGKLTHSSTMIITKHKGTDVAGYVLDDQFPSRKLAVEGRYENDVLLMQYFPAPDAENKYFIDSGCYFLRRQRDGSFGGYSVGFPSVDSASDACLDIHELRRV